MTTKINLKKKKQPVITAADFWCGGGGSSTGLREAVNELGYKLELTAVNHWEVAVATHSKNHPDARHFCKAVDSLSPLELFPERRIKLLVASPECFPAGTLVLTSESYKPIEKIKVGDLVLTHKNRWRKVTSLMNSYKDTLMVSGQGHPGIETTAEHPFYTRRRKSRHRPENGNRYKFEEAQWTNAENLDQKNLFWASPSKIEPLTVPEVGGRGFDLTLNFLWLVGLWLAEGTVRVRKTNSEITICCGNHEADYIENQLNLFASTSKRAGHSELRWRRRAVRTATLFETAHHGLAQWLVENFGKLAKGKKIPSWVYGLTADQKQALLDGYLQGDGHLERKNSNSPKQTCQTISKALAYGIKTVASTLGYRVSVHHRRPVKDEIEGRKVNISDAFGVSWTVNPQKNESFDDSEHHWTHIKKNSEGKKNVKVYNISVEEDESYVVEGIVVHNCTHHSRARGGKPRDEQRRADAWDIARWTEKLFIENLIIENVEEFTQWGPLGSDGTPLKSKRGAYFKQFVDYLKEIYSVEWRILNCADYGDATTRKRFFLLAKRGKNKKIIFPAPTHASRKVLEAGQQNLFNENELKPWVSAREIINWNLEGKNIFGRKKPLSENTMRRIYAGLRKYSGIDIPERQFSDDPEKQKEFDLIYQNSPIKIDLRKFDIPFLFNNSGTERRDRSINEPTFTQRTGRTQGVAAPHIEPFLFNQKATDRRMRSIDKPFFTQTANSQHQYVVQPYMVNLSHTGNNDETMCRDLQNPLPVICGKGMLGVVEPFFVSYHGGKKDGGVNRAHQLDNPVPTLDTSNRFGMVEAFVVPCNHGKDDTRAHSLNEPMKTITGVDALGFAEPFLVQYFGGMTAVSVDNPVTTITANYEHYAIVTPFAVKFNNNQDAQDLTEPLKTITTKDRFGLGQPFLIQFFGERKGQSSRTRDIDSPVWKVTPQIRQGVVEPFLVKLEDANGKELHGLLLLELGAILVVNFRMLHQTELAAAMSFPPDYYFHGTRDEQVKQIGNAVPVKTSKALCKAILEK